MILLQVKHNYFIGVVHIIMDFIQKAMGLIRMAVMEETIMEEPKMEEIVLEDTILERIILERIDQDSNFLIVVDIIQREIIQKGTIPLEEGKNQAIEAINNQVVEVINNQVMLDIVIANPKDIMDNQVTKDIQAIKDIQVVVDNQDLVQLQ